VLFHGVRVGGEQQEGGQRRAADGVALGQRLGGVADRIQPVRALAYFLGCCDISMMPPALSVIGPKVSMPGHRRSGEHAMVAIAVP